MCVCFTDALSAANFGDDQTMVKVGPMQSLAHDRCVFEQLGEGILQSAERGAHQVHFGSSWAGLDQAVDEDRMMLSRLPRQQSVATRNITVGMRLAVGRSKVRMMFNPWLSFG